MNGAFPRQGAARRAARGPFAWLRLAFTALRSLIPASLVMVLGGFHAWLLYDGVATGRILDIDVALRWVAGLALDRHPGGFPRLGVPLLRGRKAVVLWALVVILHAHAMATRPVALGAETPTTQVLRVARRATGGPLATAFGLILLAIGAQRAIVALRRRLVLLTSDTLAHARGGGISLAAPRPPPVVASSIPRRVCLCGRGNGVSCLRWAGCPCPPVTRARARVSRDALS